MQCKQLALCGLALLSHSGSPTGLAQCTVWWELPVWGLAQCEKDL